MTGNFAGIVPASYLAAMRDVPARHGIVMLSNDYTPLVSSSGIALDLFGDPVSPRPTTASPRLLSNIERHLRIACELIRCRSACVLGLDLSPLAHYPAAYSSRIAETFVRAAATLFPAGLPNDLAVLPDAHLDGLIVGKGKRSEPARMIVCAPLHTRDGIVVGHCLFAAARAGKLSGGHIEALRDLMLLAAEEAALSDGEEGDELLRGGGSGIGPQLIASVARQASLVERSTSPAWLVDLPSGRMLDVNRAAQAAYGYSRSEFLAMPSLESLTCETAKAGRKVSKPLSPQEMTGSWRRMHCDKGGRILAVELSAFPADLEGRPARLVLARPARLGESGLLTDEAREAALAQVSEAIIVVDLNFRITYWNAAAEALYHWRARDVLGERLPDVIQPAWSDRREERDASTMLLTSGAWSGESVHSTGAGEAVQVECAVTSLRNEKGEPVGFLCVNSASAQPVRVDAPASESEERYRSLFDFNPDAVLWLDPNGTCQSANLACKMIFGLRPDEIVDHSFFGLIDPTERSGAVAAFDRALHGEPVSFDYRSAGGSRRMSLSSVALPVIVEGEIVGVTVVTRDVSERKRLQGMIAAENELLQWLAARKPLSAIVERLVADVEERYDWLRCTVIVLNDGFAGGRKAYSSAETDLPPKTARLENFEKESTAYRAMTEARRVTAALLGQQEVGELQSSVAQRFGCAAACSSPILSSGGEPLGAFTFYTREQRAPSEEELLLADRMTTLLRVAIEADGANLRLQLHDRAMNSAVASVAILDPCADDCPIIYVNQAFEKITGYAREQALDHGLSLLYGPETDGSEISRITSAIETEQEFTGLLRLSNAAGDLFWSSTSLSPVRDAEGSLTHYIAVLNDVTALVSANEQVSESEQKFRQLIENASEIVLVLEQTGAIRYASPAVERVLGYASSEVLEHDIFEYVYPEDLVDARAELLRLFSMPEGGTSGIELRALRADGSWCSLDVSAQNLLGMPGVRGIVVHARDLSERQLAKDRLDHLAFHDSLTDLPNRLLFNEHLSRVIGSARRRGGQAAVMFLDIDRFKVINDTLGHSVGDQLLQHVAGRLVLTAREGDTVARWGGDEFTIILADVSGQREASRAAQRIIESLSEPFIISGHELYITATAGISLFPSAGGDVETLIRHADTAMYRAKEIGQNHFQFYAPKMNAGASERLALESHLRRALEREEFTLHYQPQIDARTGRMTSCEALVRWQHPEMGLVPPKDFIPLAEETGLIVPMGDWIMRTACRQARQWQEFGGDKLRVAVNLSARQFSQRDVHQMVTKMLRESGLEPTLLELEITESTLLSGEGRIVAAMRNLVSLGVSVSIDDFGVGYSSYSYLKRYPVSALKIDQSFIQGMLTSSHDHAIVQAIITMGHEMGLQVIAEGVETEQHGELLAASSCDVLQGYYYGRPMPAAKITDMLAKQQGG